MLQGDLEGRETALLPALRSWLEGEVRKVVTRIDHGKASSF